MLAGQTASWHALLDLYERHPEGWTLVGGQMVHLHCAERDYSPTDLISRRTALHGGTVTVAAPGSHGGRLLHSESRTERRDDLDPLSRAKLT